MQIYYFSWVRERIGINDENIKTDAKTLGELITELSSRNENYSCVFSDLKQIKVAIDHVFVSDLNHSIEQAKEIAFFPPVTGG
tara:strand:- start:532 stop:780 length:249 start_codon:yes stop_codon:yes gene_type:complete